MQKEGLDKYTKTIIAEFCIQQQEQMVKERDANLLLLEQGRPALPKTLISKVERIQKFVNQVKIVSENTAEALIEDLNTLNLKHYIPEIAKNIAQSKMSARDQHTMIEICVLMHQRYETFAEQLIPALETQCKQVLVSDFTKTRNILRMLTELYFKGIFKEYKLIFK